MPRSLEQRNGLAEGPKVKDADRTQYPQLAVTPPVEVQFGHWVGIALGEDVKADKHYQHTKTQSSGNEQRRPAGIMPYASLKYSL
jgi:hypothetical protein